MSDSQGNIPTGDLSVCPPPSASGDFFSDEGLSKDIATHNSRIERLKGSDDLSYKTVVPIVVSRYTVACEAMIQERERHDWWDCDWFAVNAGFNADRLVRAEKGFFHADVEVLDGCKFSFYASRKKITQRLCAAVNSFLVIKYPFDENQTYKSVVDQQSAVKLKTRGIVIHENSAMKQSENAMTFWCDVDLDGGYSVTTPQYAQRRYAEQYAYMLILRWIVYRNLNTWSRPTIVVKGEAVSKQFVSSIEKLRVADDTPKTVYVSPLSTISSKAPAEGPSRKQLAATALVYAILYSIHARNFEPLYLYNHALQANWEAVNISPPKGVVLTDDTFYDWVLETAKSNYDILHAVVLKYYAPS